MSRRPRTAATGPGKAISRRRFVGLIAASSAAVIVAPAGGAPAPRQPASPPAEPAKPAPPSAAQKEFDRQRANTLSALKTIRDYPLPPGGDLPVVFRPLSSARRSR